MFNENYYQEESRKTVRYSENIHQCDPELLFLSTAVSGEVGELNEKIKKYAREGDSYYLENIDDEIGDIIWYLARIMDKRNKSFRNILLDNLEKTNDRFDRNMIFGEGDKR